MAKIAVTPSIVLAEFIWYRNRVSVLKVTFPFWHIIFFFFFLGQLDFKIVDREYVDFFL